MSWRTRIAMDVVGIANPGHRSTQLDAALLMEADLIVGLAAEHVEFIRRRYPGMADDRTATLRRLVRDLEGGQGPVRDRVGAMGLAGVQTGPWEDVADPAGHEVDIFISCAHEIEGLVRQLLPKLGY